VRRIRVRLYEFNGDMDSLFGVYGVGENMNRMMATSKIV
jgi:hypothetical protein